ncbi:hypothetical protein [Streptomyces sp. McG3]|uniref:hypothetical protein n=1 Tax=Streptomyces sp. McG3 TaxID=2725483 RepID=UPI001BE84A3A|nr:hypothetical protein [Streptomyces sp. McG3]MBT2898522.1 hypothetical protein [Streptomyces sp. McG3]
MTTEHDHWKAQTVRRPDDVPPGTPLLWQIEKLTEHSDRLMNNDLPADFPYKVERGDVGDALAAIALRESMHRDIEHGRGTRVHDAIKLGATWSELATALDITTDAARALLRTWADGQHNLYQHYVDRGDTRPVGFDPDKYAALLALTELGDDEDNA